MIENGNLSIEGRARIDILNGAFSAGNAGAHIAPSLSDVDICLAVLQSFDESKDSFILSKGHGALGYYAAMHQVGMISDEQFGSFEKNGGEFPGQPSRNKNNKIEYSSGSLGMGLPYGVGIALAKKGKGRVFVILGDGELNEGSNWEAASMASRYKLHNLIAIVDNNKMQSDGRCEDIAAQDLERIWDAHGWQVKRCDGHSICEIKKAINESGNDKPVVLLAETIKGKGVSFMENDNSWHHATLKEADYQKAIQEIGEKYGLSEK